MTQSFSLRQIPFKKDNFLDIENPENTDKIKILELSNLIDAWEKELLFSDNGFYSLKGKDVENKTIEYIRNLKELVNSKISNIKFDDFNSKEKAVIIKDSKITAIKQQMEIYELNELKSWEIEVYENSINSSLSRALLYKHNEEIVQESYRNAIAVIKIMAEKENWDSKTYNSRKQLFDSDFYFSLINSFIKDKDIKAAVYFEDYKDKIDIEKKEKLEEAVKNLKDYVIAYNWAKQLDSYNLKDKDNEKEISLIKDKKIAPLIKTFFNEFKEDRKRQEEENEKRRNEDNWNEIISILDSEPDKAVLYIDFTLSQESQKSKKDYISKIRKNNFIETDKEKFLELLSEVFEDFEKFKKKEISNYRNILSKEDYDFINELKNQNTENHTFYISDYEYISKEFSKNSITEPDIIYRFIKYVVALKNNYKHVNNKEPDADARNKIIKTAMERYSNKSK